MQPRQRKQKTSLSLTPDAHQLLQLLATRAGVSMSAWLETQLRAQAKRHGVTPERLDNIKPKG